MIIQIVEYAYTRRKKKKSIMAEIEDRYEDNVVGKYFVDEQCIDCDLCREVASDNFKRNEEDGYSYVYKQPETEEEAWLMAGEDDWRVRSSSSVPANLSGPSASMKRGSFDRLPDPESVLVDLEGSKRL